jgi:predicted nucleotidyltransferase/DNA-binding XRE family transcriptional regulator
MSNLLKAAITPETSRAARALLGISQDELARRAGLARLTVANFERDRHTPTRANLALLRATLEAAGVNFVPGGAVLREQARAGDAAGESRLANALRTLQANAARLRRLGLKHVSIFGSSARGEARPDSDLDLLVEIDPKRRIDLLDYAGIVGELQALLPMPVDVARKGRLKPHVAAEALRDEINAF